MHCNYNKHKIGAGMELLMVGEKEWVDFLADPGQARGCSTNTLVINQFIISFIY